MKIVFLISSISKTNPGIGGHYYSLIETLNQLAKTHSVCVINIGIKEAVSLNKLDHKVINVIKKGPKLYSIYKRVKDIINEEKPDIIHSFDHISFLWARLVGQKLKIPYSLTKCGGVNPVYYPFAEHLVLFSEENKQHFQSKKKYNSSNIHIIPNRIQRFESDYDRINTIEDSLSIYNDSFKFLRITRVKEYYFESSVQLINLVNKLTEDGIKCSLIFIGTIENEEVFQKLKKLSGENCFYFTTPSFTKNAKQLLDISDAVLGTGRGFMEASSKSKIMLAPIKSSSFPLLINEENFKEAFNYNFSERLTISNFDESENYYNIKETITNPTLKQRKSELAIKLFDEFFDANRINTKYAAVFFKMKKNNKKKYFDLLLHFLFVIRAFLKQ